jgi:hypothetical protein
MRVPILAFILLAMTACGSSPGATSLLASSTKTKVTCTAENVIPALNVDITLKYEGVVDSSYGVNTWEATCYVLSHPSGTVLAADNSIGDYCTVHYTLDTNYGYWKFTMEPTRMVSYVSTSSSVYNNKTILLTDKCVESPVIN